MSVLAVGLLARAALPQDERGLVEVPASESSPLDPATRDLEVAVFPEFLNLDLRGFVVQSDAIVVGQVIEREQIVSEQGLPCLMYGIEVWEQISGETPDVVEFSIYGGHADGISVTMEGSPSLEVGDQGLFFLAGSVGDAYGLLQLDKGFYRLSDWGDPTNGLVEGAFAGQGTRAIDFVGRLVDLQASIDFERQNDGSDR